MLEALRVTQRGLRAGLDVIYAFLPAGGAWEATYYNWTKNCRPLLGIHMEYTSPNIGFSNAYTFIWYILGLHYQHL